MADGNHPASGRSLFSESADTGVIFPGHNQQVMLEHLCAGLGVRSKEHWLEWVDIFSGNVLSEAFVGMHFDE